MKLILITLLCLAASTTATPLLGEKKCTWGPAYWCQHLWSARECGAIEHCAQRVWMLQETPQQEASDADSGCQMCEKMVRGVTVLLDNKSTKGEILKYMERACTGAQTAEGVRACKNAVDAFFPAILDFVAMEMDPMVICTAMKLCPSSNSSSEEVERLENTIEEVLVVKPLLQELAPSHVMSSADRDRREANAGSSR
ncbi:PREDICTED: proactivator polypeptide-like [Priapulus caudatus]|uniref:Proactivator polypeptide-like n=1 Tax=Priapulus caudatus TaxID=37621 RepID=A0ABM1E793_PRICU|nr:PREDICTED: proactivator polypeptide-like [Priapulus caudatus]